MFKVTFDGQWKGVTNFGFKTIEVLEVQLSRVVHHNNVPDNERATGMDVYEYQYLCKGDDQIFFTDADTLHAEIDEGIYKLLPKGGVKMTKIMAEYLVSCVELLHSYKLITDKERCKIQDRLLKLKEDKKCQKK